jgi:YtkA-like protein
MDKTALCDNITKPKENHMKSYTSRTLKLMTMLCLSLFTFGCGGGGTDSTSPTPTNESVTTATFKVEYVPVTTAKTGKSTFKIKVTNKTTGAAVAGKTITFTPTMNMPSMSHSTPCEALKDNADGTYSGTIYYNMASTNTDGTSMGTWELKFAVDGEVATFNPSVAMSTGTTNRATLKGVTDVIGSMTGTSKRTYNLFNDSSTFGMSSTFRLFIAASDESTMMRFPTVSIGSSLTGLTVNTMTVEASTDNGITWNSLTDNEGGHWSVAGLTGLATGGTVKVRLIINGEQKTTDGNVAAGTNDFATFTIVAAM